MNKKIKNIILFTGLVTITLHMINKIIYSLSTVKSVLNSSDNQYFEWRFGKIKYTKKGNGTPILLLHDLTVGSSSYEYQKIISNLSKNHEIYTLDLLGYGLSDKINMTYTNYLYVQLVHEFIKTIIGRKTDIFATGYAVPIAIMTSHNDPDLIHHICLINPESLTELNKIPSKQSKLLKFIIDTPIVGTFVFNCLTTKKTFQKQFQDKLFFDSKQLEVSDVLSYWEGSHTPNALSKFSYSSFLGKYMNVNMIHALKEINHSIYLILGKEKEDQDKIIEQYKSCNSSIEVFYVLNSKHLPHLENPNDFLEIIKIII